MKSRKCGVLFFYYLHNTKMAIQRVFPCRFHSCRSLVCCYCCFFDRCYCCYPNGYYISLKRFIYLSFIFKYTLTNTHTYTRIHQHLRMHKLLRHTHTLRRLFVRTGNKLTVLRRNPYFCFTSHNSNRSVSNCVVG